MNRNALVLLGLLVALAAVLGLALVGPAGSGTEVSATGQGAGGDEERLVPTAATAPASSSDPGATDDEARREALPVAVAPVDPLADLLAVDRARISGLLVDPGGRPVPGQAIRLALLAARTTPTLAEPGQLLEEREATTDRDGRFAFPSVAALGTWFTLSAERAPWPALELGPVEPRPGQDQDLGTLSFALGEVLTLRVEDEDGLALGAAEVLLARQPGGGGGDARPIATTVGATLADGTRSLPGLAPGTWLVGARTPTHALRWSDAIAIEAGEEPAAVTLTLPPGQGLLARVVDGEDRSPVPGAEVLVRPRGDGDAPSEVLVADAGGLVRRPSTAVGERLRYEARAPGYLPAWGQLREDPATAGQLTLEVTLTREVDVTVLVLDDATGLPVVDARVVDVEGEQGRAEAALRAGLGLASADLPPGAEELARTDAEGFATVPAPPADRRLQVLAKGYLAARVDLPRDRTSAAAGAVEVRLERGAGVTALVVGPDGPHAAAVVELCLVSSNPAEGESSGREGERRNRWGREPAVSVSDLVWSDVARLLPVERRATDAAGGAVFEALPEGYFRVTAEAPGLGRVVSEPLRLRSSEDRLEVRLELLAAAAVEGRVTLLGEPGPDQRVIAMRELRAAIRGSMPAEAEVHTTRSDAEGSYRLEGLGPGTWRLFAVRPGQAQGGDAANGWRSVLRQLEDHAVLVDLVAGDLRVVDLDAQGPGATLSGIVRVNHEPLGDLRVAVSVFEDDGSRAFSRTTTTDGAGRYAVDGLPPGEVEVRVQAEGQRSGGLYVERLTLARATTRVGEQGAHTYDLSLEAGALTLTVQAPQGAKPAEEQRGGSWVQVQLSPDQTRGGVPGVTGRSLVRGWFRLGDTATLPLVPVGPYAMTLQADGAKTMARDLDVAAGVPTVLDLQLEAPEDA